MSSEIHYGVPAPAAADQMMRMVENAASSGKMVFIGVVIAEANDDGVHTVFAGLYPQHMPKDMRDIVTIETMVTAMDRFTGRGGT